jgi:hypothetical protein
MGHLELAYDLLVIMIGLAALFVFAGHPERVGKRLPAVLAVAHGLDELVQARHVAVLERSYARVHEIRLLS